MVDAVQEEPMNRSIALISLFFVVAAGCNGPRRPEVITSAEAFDAAIAKGKSVLFVDCPWNHEVKLLELKFNKFAESVSPQEDFRILTIDLDDEHDSTWRRLATLWKQNDIELGGLKNLNGAGRIVWFQDGKVVDYEWGMNLDEKALRERTEKAWKR